MSVRFSVQQLIAHRILRGLRDPSSKGGKGWRLRFALRQTGNQVIWMLACGGSLRGYQRCYGLDRGKAIWEADLAALNTYRERLYGMPGYRALSCVRRQPGAGMQHLATRDADAKGGDIDDIRPSERFVD